MAKSTSTSTGRKNSDTVIGEHISNLSMMAEDAEHTAEEVRNVIRNLFDEIDAMTSGVSQKRKKEIKAVLSKGTLNLSEVDDELKGKIETLIGSVRWKVRDVTLHGDSVVGSETVRIEPMTKRDTPSGDAKAEKKTIEMEPINIDALLAEVGDGKERDRVTREISPEEAAKIASKADDSTKPDSEVDSEIAKVDRTKIQWIDEAMEKYPQILNIPREKLVALYADTDCFHPQLNEKIQTWQNMETREYDAYSRTLNAILMGQADRTQVLNGEFSDWTDSQILRIVAKNPPAELIEKIREKTPLPSERKDASPTPSVTKKIEEMSREEIEKEIERLTAEQKKVDGKRGGSIETAGRIWDLQIQLGKLAPASKILPDTPKKDGGKKMDTERSGSEKKEADLDNAYEAAKEIPEFKELFGIIRVLKTSMDYLQKKGEDGRKKYASDIKKFLGIEHHDLHPRGERKVKDEIYQALKRLGLGYLVNPETSFPLPDSESEKELLDDILNANKSDYSPDNIKRHLASALRGTKSVISRVTGKTLSDTVSGSAAPAPVAPGVSPTAKPGAVPKGEPKPPRKIETKKAIPEALNKALETLAPNEAVYVEAAWKIYEDKTDIPKKAELRIRMERLKRLSGMKTVPPETLKKAIINIVPFCRNLAEVEPIRQEMGELLHAEGILQGNEALKDELGQLFNILWLDESKIRDEGKRKVFVKIKAGINNKLHNIFEIAIEETSAEEKASKILNEIRAENLPLLIKHFLIKECGYKEEEIFGESLVNPKAGTESTAEKGDDTKRQEVNPEDSGNIKAFLDQNAFKEHGDTRRYINILSEKLESAPEIASLLKQLMDPDLTRQSFYNIMEQLQKKIGINKESVKGRYSTIYATTLPCGVFIDIDLYMDMNNDLSFGYRIPDYVLENAPDILSTIARESLSFRDFQIFSNAWRIHRGELKIDDPKYTKEIESIMEVIIKASQSTRLTPEKAVGLALKGAMPRLKEIMKKNSVFNKDKDADGRPSDKPDKKDPPSSSGGTTEKAKEKEVSTPVKKSATPDSSHAMSAEMNPKKKKKAIRKMMMAVLRNSKDNPLYVTKDSLLFGHNKKDPASLAIEQLILEQNLDINKLEKFLKAPVEITSEIENLAKKGMTDLQNMFKTAKNEVGRLTALIGGRASSEKIEQYHKDLEAAKDRLGDIDSAIKLQNGTTRYDSTAHVLAMINLFISKKHPNQIATIDTLSDDIIDYADRQIMEQNMKLRGIRGGIKNLLLFGILKPNLTSVLKALADDKNISGSLKSIGADKLADLAKRNTSESVRAWAEDLHPGSPETSYKTEVPLLIAYLETVLRDGRTGSYVNTFSYYQTLRLVKYLKSARRAHLVESLQGTQNNNVDLMNEYFQRLNSMTKSQDAINVDVIKHASRWRMAYGATAVATGLTGGAVLGAGSAISTIIGSSAGLGILPAIRNLWQKDEAIKNKQQKLAATTLTLGALSSPVAVMGLSAGWPVALGIGAASGISALAYAIYKNRKGNKKTRASAPKPSFGATPAFAAA